MKCKSCGLETPDGRTMEGKCEGCYRDPNALPVTGVLIYVAVVLFLLVIIFL